MLDQDMEILISRYADGDEELTPGERDRVERLIAGDPEARRMLTEYQALTAALRDAAPAVPELDWDRLHQHISASTSDLSMLSHRSRLLIGPSPMTMPTRWALAASVLLCIGIALLATQPAKVVDPVGSVAHANLTPDVQPPAVATSIYVSGPEIDPPLGSVQVDISIGRPAPAESVADSAQDIVWRQPRIQTIAADTSTTEPMPAPQ